jgi:hypothetical protein
LGDRVQGPGGEAGAAADVDGAVEAFADAEVALDAGDDAGVDGRAGTGVAGGEVGGCEEGLHGEIIAQSLFVRVFR